MSGRAEEVKGVFEEYAERYIELLNKFAKERARLWNEIKDDDELEEALYKVDAKEAEAIEELRKQFEKKLNREVEWGVRTRSHCYYSAPGHEYYECVEYHRAIDKIAKKAYLVAVHYRMLIKPGGTGFELDGVGLEERELVDEEETPFAAALVENLDWCYIRDTWLRNIEGFIEEIAAAERQNRLEEALKKVKEKVESGLWIYDYQHFLSALYKTAEEFNIQL